VGEPTVDRPAPNLGGILFVAIMLRLVEKIAHEGRIFATLSWG